MNGYSMDYYSFEILVDDQVVRHVCCRAENEDQAYERVNKTLQGNEIAWLIEIEPAI